MTTTQQAPSTPTATIAEVTEVNVGLPATVRCGDFTNTHPAARECGAQAYVEVELPDGGRIEFCAHHYRKRELGLVTRAKRIIDHRPFLMAQEHKFKGINTR